MRIRIPNTGEMCWGEGKSVEGYYSEREYVKPIENGVSPRVFMNVAFGEFRENFIFIRKWFLFREISSNFA